ncbi:NERD domain protein [Cuniculiplasma divulgatum]|uniref:NERD domain protein n=1 Tax=Cuniculiplasma divulgatum TaxID=1673428 RepID=A0A1R4A7B4_9ARCH|nr:NERD domain protein [Cuniculiplasma divulgatum]
MYYFVNNSLFYTNNFRKVDVNSAIEELRRNYAIKYRDQPDVKQINAWRGSISALSQYINDGTWVFMEYGFPIGTERVDFLIARRGHAFIIESKGWNSYVKKNEIVSLGDNQEVVNPCYQIQNYVAKMRNFHSSSSLISFDGFVYMYNTRDGNECKILYNGMEVESELKILPVEVCSEEEINVLENGTFRTSRELIDFISANRENIMENVSRKFLNAGFGLSEEQAIIVEKIMNSLRKGERKKYFISGGMGSGKTLMAINLLFMALSEGYQSLLAYRNNRLINTLRRVFGSTYSSLLCFYSMGFNGHFKGLGEENFDSERLRLQKLLIYDEAQRMTIDVMRKTLSYDKTSVYFFDENQILINDEDGRKIVFKSEAERSGTNFEFISLSGYFRMIDGDKYGRFIDGIFTGNDYGNPGEYDLRLFDDINNMIDNLKHKKENEDTRIALLASYTFSDGRKEKKRVINPEIKWLMDPKTEYPQYWMGLHENPFKYCASIYGSQGFETDYVGLIWGEDLVWRDKWVVQPEKITDTIGGRSSIKSVCKSNPERGKEMLFNRYRILLTRGMKGTSVYFEDADTFDHMNSVLEKSRISVRST